MERFSALVSGKPIVILLLVGCCAGALACGAEATQLPVPSTPPTYPGHDSHSNSSPDSRANGHSNYIFDTNDRSDSGLNSDAGAYAYSDDRSCNGSSVDRQRHRPSACPLGPR